MRFTCTKALPPLVIALSVLSACSMHADSVSPIPANVAPVVAASSLNTTLAIEQTAPSENDISASVDGSITGTERTTILRVLHEASKQAYPSIKKHSVKIVVLDTSNMAVYVNRSNLRIVSRGVVYK